MPTIVIVVQSGWFQIGNDSSCERTSVGARKNRTKIRTNIGDGTVMVREDEGTTMVRKVRGVGAIHFIPQTL